MFILRSIAIRLYLEPTYKKSLNPLFPPRYYIQHNLPESPTINILFLPLFRSHLLVGSKVSNDILYVPVSTTLPSP